MRKPLFYLLPVVYCLLGFASYAQDSSQVKMPEDTSAFYIMEMNDGLVLKGRVIEKNEKEIKFRDHNLGIVSVKIRKISSFEKISADSYFLFYMKDGSYLHGRIIRQSENEVEIETKSIGKTTIPLERVKQMRQIEEKNIHRKGKYWYPNPNASRYFFGPSAIPMKKGDGYYQNADLLVNSANYGITKNFSIQGGGILPFAVFLMPKFGYKVNEVLHVGGGMVYARTLLKFRKENYKMGALFGLGTFGNNNNNLTFGLGYGFSNLNKETTYYSKPIMTFSGMVRISRRIALVSENIIMPIKFTYYNATGKTTDFNYKSSVSYGMRLMKEKITIDFGIISIPNDLFSAFVFIDLVIKF